VRPVTLRPHPAASGAPHTRIKERDMYKMAIFLGGFLTLTILIGVLATISPV
jgi:hypothetical protein